MAGAGAGHGQRRRAADVAAVLVELGLDSVERMDIINSLEEAYGGRFPEEVLPTIETVREVAAAVEMYLGAKPLAKSELRTLTPSDYKLELFPEIAKRTNQIAILRSLKTPNNDHGVAGTVGLTGSSAGGVGLIAGDGITVIDAEGAARATGCRPSGSATNRRPKGHCHRASAARSWRRCPSPGNSRRCPGCG